MREIFKQLFGNERIKSTLGESIERGTASHAYIIEGPKGSGKHTLATLAAAALSCENRSDAGFALPCGVCPVCGRILKGISADVITVSKEDKASIGIGKIRSIREDLYVTPNDSDNKVYVIEEADLMTPQAQNGLLISLEEPPAFVTFFLLTENSEALLETVKSRSVTLRMELFSPEKIKEFLVGHSSSAISGPGYNERLIRAGDLSNGSPGEAKRIFLERENNENDVVENSRSLAAHLISGKTSDALESVAPFLSGGIETSRKMLTAVSSYVAAMIRYKKAPATVNSNLLTSEEKETLRSVSLKRMISVFDMTVEALELVSSNVTPKTAVYDLIFKCRK